jgi:hypothetical protein
MQFSPPVVSGAAATLGLNAMATPHNPTPAATTPTLTRPKFATDIDSSIRAFKWCNNSGKPAIAARQPR